MLYQKGVEYRLSHWDLRHDSGQV